MPKYLRRRTRFSEKIIAMHACGMALHETQGYLVEKNGTEVSPELISKISDEVTAEVAALHSWPLDWLYAVICLDARWVKLRDNGVVRSRAVCLALGMLPDGTRPLRSAHLD